MTEEFIHYIWLFRQMQGRPLRTGQGEELEVIHAGLRNPHAGPDFSSARLRIGGMVWAGNVEAHVRSSDWYRHEHHNDSSYDSVILHVVYEDDRPVQRKDGSPVPVLELKGHIDAALWRRYCRMKDSPSWPACRSHLRDVPGIVRYAWLDRLAVERLEHKAVRVMELLKECAGDWEEAAYRLLARGFGFGVNALPFEMLARSLPLKILQRLRNDCGKAEALLYGQAGMLHGQVPDEYHAELKREYAYLASLHGLEPGSGHLWKLLRMRPANFPAIRISQFAAVLCRTPSLFAALTGARSAGAVRELLTATASPYWDHHYRFGEYSAGRPKVVGGQAVDVLLVNAVIPLVFAYGKYTGDGAATDRAIRFLEDIAAEKNRIVSKWADYGLVPLHAAHSQALLELRSAWCISKKCLTCGIGTNILCKSSLPAY